MESNAARSIPPKPGVSTRPKHLAPAWKPGQSGNPAGRPSLPETRNAVARSLFVALSQKGLNQDRTFIERILERAINDPDPTLCKVILDKLAPTLTPEVTNVLIAQGMNGAFEQRIQQMRMEREAAAQVTPPAPAPARMIDAPNQTP